MSSFDESGLSKSIALLRLFIEVQAPGTQARHEQDACLVRDWLANDGLRVDRDTVRAFLAGLFAAQFTAQPEWRAAWPGQAPGPAQLAFGAVQLDKALEP